MESWTNTTGGERNGFLSWWIAAPEALVKPVLSSKRRSVVDEQKRKIGRGWWEGGVAHQINTLHHYVALVFLLLFFLSFFFKPSMCARSKFEYAWKTHRPLHMKHWYRTIFSDMSIKYYNSPFETLLLLCCWPERHIRTCSIIYSFFWNEYHLEMTKTEVTRNVINSNESGKHSK